MSGSWRQQLRHARRVPFPKLAIVVVIIAGAALTSACSQPSDTQQRTAQQQQQGADEQARKEADEKAWAHAEKTGTVAAYTAYLQNFLCSTRALPVLNPKQTSAAHFARLGHQLAVRVTSSSLSSSGTKPLPPHVGHCCSSSVPFPMTPSPLQSGQVLVFTLCLPVDILASHWRNPNHREALRPDRCNELLQTSVGFGSVATIR
jgi:hypothetical protein